MNQSSFIYFNKIIFSYMTIFTHTADFSIYNKKLYFKKGCIKSLDLNAKSEKLKN